MRVPILLQSLKKADDKEQYKDVLDAIESLHNNVPFSPEEATEFCDGLDLDLVELTDKSQITKAFFAMKFSELGLKCTIQNNKFIFQ